jgi:hypothetical protein
MLTVRSSTLAGNTAGGFGGGLYNNLLAITTMDRSTLYGNSTTTDSGSGGNGGAIYNHDQATLTVSNSTLSANEASFGGGGVYSSGGASTTLINVTITNNRANTIVSGSLGGGLFIPTSATFAPVLHNTLIAGNFKGASGNARDDVFGALATSSDFNLIGDGTGLTGITDGVNGNQVGTAASPIDPLLGPLQDNGGPTLTQALLAGSPAIGGGSTAYATATDQRGFPRVVNGQIDIGAFQTQPSSRVTNLTDSGPGSLRSALADTPAGGTVDFLPA